MRFNLETASFSGSFSVDTSISQPSILYWNKEFWYQEGIMLNLYDTHNRELISGKQFIVDTSTQNYIKFQITDESLNNQLIYISVVSIRSLETTQ